MGRNALKRVLKKQEMKRMYYNIVPNVMETQRKDTIEAKQPE